MRGPYPNSRIALKLRRLRGRFGIAAPRVTVRTHVPWYWRALGIALTGAVALAMAGWVYDAGRRIAGFDRSESALEIDGLREKLGSLQIEVEKLRAANNASESSLQIERTAQQQLTVQVKMLEAENNRLKEENAVFERLAQGDNKESTLTITRLQVVPDASGGRYRYQFFAAQNGGQRGREFKGNLQLVVNLLPNDTGGMITFPRPNDPDADRYIIVFKHFRRFDGVFTLPAGSKPKSVEVRLMQDGTIRSAQTVSL